MDAAPGGLWAWFIMVHSGIWTRTATPKLVRTLVKMGGSLERESVLGNYGATCRHLNTPVNTPGTFVKEVTPTHMHTLNLATLTNPTPFTPREDETYNISVIYPICVLQTTTLPVLSVVN